jgi:general secretion pathway protein K
MTRSLTSCQKGVSLVVVLWVLALLMIIATELVYTVRVDSLSAANFRDEAAAQALASAGINLGIAEIAAPYKFVVLDKERRVGFLRQDEKDTGRSRSFELGGGNVEYVIEDDAGRLNLNTAPREVIVDLFRDSCVEGAGLDIIADSIIDWRDENHEHHLNGAEDDYYMSLSSPYGAKDGNFDTVEEVLLVKGMSPAVLYGTEKTSETDKTWHSELKGIANHLTVIGDGKININTASEEVLRAALGEGKAQEILLRRKTEGYYTIPAFGGTVSSSVFTIVSTGTVRGLSFKIRASAEKSGKGVRVVYWNEGVLPGMGK